MFDKWERFKVFLGRLVDTTGPRQKPQRAGLRVETLEERMCPAGTWDWINPAGGLWSNPNGNNWLHNGALAPATQYPGMGGSVNDEVYFNNAAAGNCTLDAIVPNWLETLEIGTAGWGGTLTVDSNLTVDSPTGDFKLADNSTILLTNSHDLILQDLNPLNPTINSWTDGTITDDGTNLFGIQLAQF